MGMVWNGAELKEGDEMTLVELTCPYCGESEQVVMGEGQYSSFDEVWMSDDGLTRVWLCRECRKRFYTELK